jgi:hypothetical protein
MDLTSPATTTMLSYVNGDLGEDATDEAMSQARPGKELLFYLEVLTFPSTANEHSTSERSAACET